MNGLSLPDPALRLLWCDYKILPAGVWKFHQAARPFWRLYWNQSRGATIWCGRTQFSLDPSTLLLIAPHTIISTSNSEDVAHFYIHFQIHSEHFDPPSRIAALPLSPALKELKDQIIEQLRDKETSLLACSATISALVLAAWSKLDFKAPPSPCSDARILHLLTYLEEQIALPHSNASLARRANMSLSAFNRQFRKQLGLSFQDYLRNRRVERACQLLQDSDDSIETIAENVGFCDRFYFSKVFKTLHGMGPGAFRQLHQDLRSIDP